MKRAAIGCLVFGCFMAAFIQSVDHGQFVIAGAAIVAGLLYAYRGVFLRALPSRGYVVHSSGGSRQEVAIHEGGHVALIEDAGGTVVEAVIHPGGLGGYTRFTIPDDTPVESLIAIDVAGEVATGTSRGCRTDHNYMQQTLATLPSGERSRVKRAGYSRANSVIHGFFGDGGVSRTANKLLRNGRI